VKDPATSFQHYPLKKKKPTQNSEKVPGKAGGS